jgi:hypothetical protein
MGITSAVLQQAWLYGHNKSINKKSPDVRGYVSVKITEV